MDRKLAVMGLRVDNREDISPAVQEVLSDYGAEILMRAGVPSPDREKGLIALTLDADEQRLQQLGARLTKIEGVEVRTVWF